MYSKEVTTRNADLMTSKRILNSVISTPTAKYMEVDTCNFCLAIPTNRYKSMSIPIKVTLNNLSNIMIL